MHINKGRNFSCKVGIFRHSKTTWTKVARFWLTSGQLFTKENLIFNQKLRFCQTSHFSKRSAVRISVIAPIRWPGIRNGSRGCIYVATKVANENYTSTILEYLCGYPRQVHEKNAHNKYSVYIIRCTLDSVVKEPSRLLYVRNLTAFKCLNNISKPADEGGPNPERPPAGKILGFRRKKFSIWESRFYI